MKKVLLHICCGICAGHVIDTLRGDGFEVTGFFYNPNIAPEEEYCRRLQVAQEVAAIKEMPLYEGAYETQRWQECVRGLEETLEGGPRCNVCFRLRLQETFRRMNEGDYRHFASTLSISPHKNTAEINSAGFAIGQRAFLAYDFKQHGGFKQTMEFAKHRKLYRQNYCGCIFSRHG